MNDFYIGYWQENVFFVHPIGKMTCHGEFMAEICYEMSRTCSNCYVFITKEQYTEYVFANRVYCSFGYVPGVSYSWA